MFLSDNSFSLIISYFLNKKLNLNRAQFIKNENNILELNERDKIIDIYYVYGDDPNREIKDLSSSLAYFLGFSKNELVGHDYRFLLSKDARHVVDFIKSKVEINNKTYILEEVPRSEKKW